MIYKIQCRDDIHAAQFQFHATKVGLETDIEDNSVVSVICHAPSKLLEPIKAVGGLIINRLNSEPIKIS